MRNEEDLLPYFLRYYSTFADKIFIIDDSSTDNTVKIAKTNRKVKLPHYKFSGYSEAEHNSCFETYYKKYSRGIADWVMVVDGDEFVYNKDLINVLKVCKSRGFKIIKTSGYTMFSENFPTTKGQIYEECSVGLRSHVFDKAIIFDPTIDVSFSAGRHQTFAAEGININRAKILLLHYRYLSKETSLKRLERTTPYSKRRMTLNIKTALARYEAGVAAIKSGSLIKII